MMKLRKLALLALLPGLVWASGPRVEMQTNLGKIIVELEAEKAPKTVANFLSYVDDGSYNNSLFHRVIPGFVAQAGGYNAGFNPLPTNSPVENESANGLSNRRGTLAMARMSDPNSSRLPREILLRCVKQPYRYPLREICQLGIISIQFHA